MSGLSSVFEFDLLLKLDCRLLIYNTICKLFSVWLCFDWPLTGLSGSAVASYRINILQSTIFWLVLRWPNTGSNNNSLIFYTELLSAGVKFGLQIFLVNCTVKRFTGSLVISLFHKYWTGLALVLFGTGFQFNIYVFCPIDPAIFCGHLFHFARFRPSLAHRRESSVAWGQLPDTPGFYIAQEEHH